MKTKFNNVNKKLQLNKVTIEQLSYKHLNEIKGGSLTTMVTYSTTQRITTAKPKTKQG